MRVLITRAENDAAEMTTSLDQLGIHVTVAPLLSVVFEDIALVTLTNAGSLIVTSRNGLKSLARSMMKAGAQAGAPCQMLERPIFTVGPATSALARDLGFLNIIEGPGSAAGLVPVILARKAEIGSRPLVHVAGDTLAFDLKGALGAHDIAVDQVSAYRIDEAATLPAGVITALSGHELDAVVLMSPRTAGVWTRLVNAAGLETNVSNLTHVCLSEAVAQRVQIQPPPKIALAAMPNGQEILSLIRRLAADAGTG
jgi:uroporphyrinogen-III synthase